MSAPPRIPEVCPDDDARLRRYIAIAERRYGKTAVMTLKPKDIVCPRCHGQIPTQHQQEALHYPIRCQFCGTVLWRQKS